jgi:hypothetical protein
MQPAEPFGRRFRHHGAHHRLGEHTVKGEIDLRHPRRSRKAPFVGRIVAAQRANVVEGARLATHDPLAGHEVGACRVIALCLEYRLVEARRQHVDQVDVVGELAILLARYGSRHEDSEMTR